MLAGMASALINDYSWGGLVLRYIAILIFIAGLAYLSTVLLARYYKKGASSRNIKLIEKISLAADRSLWLVELGEKYYFFYVDKNGLKKLDQFERDELSVINEINDKTNIDDNFLRLFKQKINNSEQKNED